MWLVGVQRAYRTARPLPLIHPARAPVRGVGKIAPPQQVRKELEWRRETVVVRDSTEIDLLASVKS